MEQLMNMSNDIHHSIVLYACTTHLKLKEESESINDVQVVIKKHSLSVTRQLSHLQT